MNSAQDLNSWRGTFLKYVLFLGFATLVFFSVDYWVQGRYIFSVVEFVIGILMLVIYFLLVKNKITWLTSSFFGWIGILFILTMILMYGGIGGVGLVWWGLLPVLSFMFFGVNGGLFATLIGSLVPVSLMVIEFLGIEASFFNVLQVRQMLFMVFVIGVIMSSYEKAVKILLLKLSSDSDRISQEAEKRLMVEKELDKRLSELKTRADRDEKIRAAVVNILEDERVLENQLKLEKEGVEKKVEERTKELEVERKRLFSFLSSIPEGVFVLDSKGTPYFSNKTAEEILGLGVKKVSKDELTKTYRVYRSGTNDLYPTEEQPLVLALSGKSTTVSDMEIDRDGVRIPIRVTGAPVYNAKNEVEYGIVVFQDITEEVIMNRSKDEFFSIASHELRTPLTAIRGNSEMILDNYRAKIKEKDVLEMLDDIHEGSIRLIEIVNDFLNISRLEMGKIDFKVEKVELGSVLKETLDEFESSGIKPGLELKVVGLKNDVRVNTDKDRLKQVVINLVGNALKFTEKGGVYLENFTVEGTNLLFDVRDTGAGIAKEQQSLLFRKFQQAGSSLYTRDTSKGTGLGLYISKLLMEGMKGRIWLKYSESGKGTIFTVSLPLAK